MKMMGEKNSKVCYSTKRKCNLKKKVDFSASRQRNPRGLVITQGNDHKPVTVALLHARERYRGRPTRYNRGFTET